MTATIEKITDINSVLKEIFEFTQTDEIVKKDFGEYLATVGAQNIPLNKVEKVFLPYIFERRIGEDATSILELFLKGKKGSDKKIAESLAKAQSSIFEIKKILKNGFELYNLINEKTYNVLSLTKMTNFRGVYAGQYIVARIFEFDKEYYVVEIANVLSHSQKSEAMRYAVMKLIQNPKLLYLDNKEKENEVKAMIAEMYKKFIKTFNKDMILTTNKYADEIIGAFNEDEEIDLSDKVSNLEEYKFFHVRELDNNYKNFLENSLGGFSSHSEVYDVAVVFDENRGLFAIPFYETFCQIFKSEKRIVNAKECIEYFLKNDSVPDIIIERVYNENSNFMDVVNEVLGTNYTYEELMQKYKPEYLESTVYSSATVLYCSNAFSQTFDIISTPVEQKPKLTGKVGRNELCPCGSGKKFKNCCGK